MIPEKIIEMTFPYSDKYDKKGNRPINPRHIAKKKEA